MALWTEHIQPAELTGYARQALADRAENQFSLARFLPNRFVNDLVYRFNQGGGALLEAADYRAYDAEPTFGARERVAQRVGELPPIGRQMLLNEFDQLRLRNADGEVRELLLRDAERVTRQIDARFELARGDALTNGSVTLEENGVTATVDYGRDPSHTVTAQNPWSDPATSNVVDDLESWTQTYSDSNGQRPGAILCSLSVARAMRRSEQVRSQLYPGNPDRRLTEADVNAWLADYGLPPIVVFDAKVRYQGAERRIIPEDRLLLLPGAGDANDADSADLGGTFWGTTLEANEPSYSIEDGDKPGIVVAAHKTDATPIQVTTVAAAIGIPVMANPDLSFVATVL